MRTIANLLTMWQAVVLDPAKIIMAKDAASTIMRNKEIYQVVGDHFDIPFYVIGAIHYREASFDFSTFLANGDPLFSADGQELLTVHVPQGLGPFPNWQAAAIGTLEYRGWGVNWHWDIANTLDNTERYNGLGYAQNGMVSPYNFAGTNQYTAGLYVADGKLSKTMIDQRVGCAAIFLSLKQNYGVDLNEPIAA